MRLAIWFVVFSGLSLALLLGGVEYPLVHQMHGGVGMMVLMIWVYGYRNPDRLAHNGGEG